MKKKIICLLVGMTLVLTILAGMATGKRIVSTNDNTPPNPPEISGPTSGDTGEFYTYSFKLTDPDEDDPLSLMEVNWGAGDIEEIQPTGCCGAYWNNGEIVNVSNQWQKQGTYEITARVMDAHGEWSEWSDPYPVSMPKSRLIQSHLLQRLISLFLILEQILS